MLRFPVGFVRLRPVNFVTVRTLGDAVGDFVGTLVRVVQIRLLPRQQ